MRVRFNAYDLSQNRGIIAILRIGDLESRHGCSALVLRLEHCYVYQNSIYRADEFTVLNCQVAVLTFDFIREALKSLSMGARALLSKLAGRSRDGC